MTSGMMDIVCRGFALYLDDTVVPVANSKTFVSARFISSISGIRSFVDVLRERIPLESPSIYTSLPTYVAFRRSRSSNSRNTTRRDSRDSHKSKFDPTKSKTT